MIENISRQVSCEKETEKDLNIIQIKPMQLTENFPDKKYIVKTLFSLKKNLFILEPSLRPIPRIVHQIY